jgi:hypothetical protein
MLRHLLVSVDLRSSTGALQSLTTTLESSISNLQSPNRQINHHIARKRHIANRFGVGREAMMPPVTVEGAFTFRRMQNVAVNFMGVMSNADANFR